LGYPTVPFTSGIELALDEAESGSNSEAAAARRIWFGSGNPTLWMVYRAHIALSFHSGYCIREIGAPCLWAITSFADAEAMPGGGFDRRRARPKAGPTKFEPVLGRRRATIVVQTPANLALRESVGPFGALRPISADVMGYTSVRLRPPIHALDGGKARRRYRPTSSDPEFGKTATRICRLHVSPNGLPRQFASAPTRRP
jgi:hypothetical protein